MIYGIGTDIMEVARMKKTMENTPSIRERLFSENEIAYCEGKARKYEHYCGRFAAKEAFVKALRTGLRDALSFHEIEIVNDELGAPSIQLLGASRDSVLALGDLKIHLSISHIKETATAFVVLERF
ncbi:MAG: holo-ACP synthase [Candidatus Cloacimonetes bacterium]|nr:holo-ACP synthase [Candidatus Cloacimonadota bacterium]